MASELAREKAAQAWCTEKTSGTVMDVDLAEAFADILDETWLDQSKDRQMGKSNEE